MSTISESAADAIVELVRRFPDVDQQPKMIKALASLFQERQALSVHDFKSIMDEHLITTVCEIYKDLGGNSFDFDGIVAGHDRFIGAKIMHAAKRVFG